MFYGQHLRSAPAPTPVLKASLNILTHRVPSTTRRRLTKTRGSDFHYLHRSEYHCSSRNTNTSSCLHTNPSTFTRSFISSPRQQGSFRSFSRYNSTKSATWARSPQTNSVRSALITSTTLLIFGLATGALCIYTLYPSTRDDKHIDEVDLDANEALKNILQKDLINWAEMTGETVPGRPGTLTPQQEEKLRVLWISVLHIFGKLEKEHVATKTAATKAATAPAEPDLTRTATQTSVAKKTKRGWFGRKYVEEETPDSSGKPVEHMNISEAEDKYGQTAQFKHALANMSPEVLRQSFWDMVKHDNPDALLLRFLRARKWDIEKALVMMVSTMHWRLEEQHVDDQVVVEGEEAMLAHTKSSDPKEQKWGNDIIKQLQMGKTYLHGVDREGRPICVIQVHLHRPGEQTEKALQRFTVFVIEYARFLLREPIDTSCIIFDMSHFTLANMELAPIKFIIKCFEANYPESLGVVLIHKAPWVFQGVWRIIKPLLDPVVAAKVHFTNNNTDLGAILQDGKIPKQLGGDYDFNYEYVPPREGENAKMQDTATRDKIQAERNVIYQEYEQATIDWIDNPDDVETKKKRIDLRNKLADQYWTLDPYIRQRTYYDRIGMLDKNGNRNPWVTGADAQLQLIDDGVQNLSTEEKVVDPGAQAQVPVPAANGANGATNGAIQEKAAAAQADLPTTAPAQGTAPGASA